MDNIPQSLRSFLMDSNFEFVGVGVINDLRMLKNDYGLKCNKGIDVYLLARKKKACSNFFWSTEIFDKGADGS